MTKKNLSNALQGKQLVYIDWVNHSKMISCESGAFSGENLPAHWTTGSQLPCSQLQSAPLYRRDLDIVAVASGGGIAEFCTIFN